MELIGDAMKPPGRRVREPKSEMKKSG